MAVRALHRTLLPAQPARRMLLPKHDVPLGTVQRPPGADAPLQRAADTGTDLGMAAPDLVENGDRPQARDALEQRHNLAVPDPGQRIRSTAASQPFLLRRKPRISLETIGGGCGEPRFGCGNARPPRLAETHIHPHLTVRDVAARPSAIPQIDM